MRTTFLLALAILLATPLAAQIPTPLGDEFQVNTTVAGAQEAPVVVTDAVGNFTVVWQSNGQDGSGFGIYARKYSRLTGMPITAEQRVNDNTAGNQQTPAASMVDAGHFAVVWEGPDASGSGIWVKVLSSSGTTLVSERLVNATSAGNQRAPAVALSEGGGFLVAWQGPGDGSGDGIRGRLFNAAGTALTGDFAINTTTTGDQVRPVVRPADGPGAYVVAWAGPDGSGSGVFAQPISSGGVLVGGEIDVNVTTTGEQERPALAVDDDVSFTVVWEGPDGDARGIFLRFFDSDGTPLGGEMMVNESIVGDQYHPDVAQGDGEDDSQPVVAWASIGGETIEGTPIFIRGRRGLGGALTGGSSEFEISALGTVVDNPSIAAAATGNFTVAWESQGQDTSGNGVFSRRFALPIFSDGFETGDASAWSSIVP